MEIKRTEQRVWLDGVAGFSSGDWASSVHGAQARILEAIGYPMGYDDLVCYDGFAFRVGAHDQMCPSAGNPFCGYVTFDLSGRSRPWRIAVYEYSPDQPSQDLDAFKSRANTAIKDSIDRGIPVHYGSAEDGLIIGYADEGQRWWCVHPYHKNGEEAFWHDEAEGFAGPNWPWGIGVWLEPKPAEGLVSDRELTLGALRKAVDMWTSNDCEEHYCVGTDAYDSWLGWLQAVERGEIIKPQDGMQGNGWYFDVLVQNRRVASRWLRERATELPESAGQHLLRAADCYAKIVETCMEGLANPWELTLGPGRFDEWTSDLRRTQIDRVEDSRELDRCAVEAIGKALSAVA